MNTTHITPAVTAELALATNSEMIRLNFAAAAASIGATNAAELYRSGRVQEACVSESEYVARTSSPIESSFAWSIHGKRLSREVMRRVAALLPKGYLLDGVSPDSSSSKVRATLRWAGSTDSSTIRVEIPRELYDRIQWELASQWLLRALWCHPEEENAFISRIMAGDEAAIREVANFQY